MARLEELDSNLSEVKENLTEAFQRVAKTLGRPLTDTLQSLGTPTVPVSTLDVFLHMRSRARITEFPPERFMQGSDRDPFPPAA